MKLRFPSGTKGITWAKYSDVKSILYYIIMQPGKAKAFIMLDNKLKSCRAKSEEKRMFSQAT